MIAKACLKVLGVEVGKRDRILEARISQQMTQPLPFSSIVESFPLALAPTDTLADSKKASETPLLNLAEHSKYLDALILRATFF